MKKFLLAIALGSLCAQIKRQCVFIEQVGDSLIPGLPAKKYDLIVSSMSITADRLKVIDFTDGGRLAGGAAGVGRDWGDARNRLCARSRQPPVFLHQGLLEEQGKPAQVLAQPKSARLAQFLSGSLK